MNPEPEPSQDSCSPEIDPYPPYPEPTAPEASPDPAPSAQEDRTSTGPAHIAEEDRTNPGEEPPVTPPVHSLVDRPASSPIPASEPLEKDRLSPYHNPSPMEVVAMDTDRAGHTGPSPSSSPPVSPCPRLEDEDSLSPLFQLSEDSGGSPTPSLGHSKKRCVCVCVCGSNIRISNYPCQQYSR